MDNVSSDEAKRIHNKSDKLSVQKGEKRKASPTKFQFKKKGKRFNMLALLIGKWKSSPICKVQEEIKDMEWYNKDKEEKLERVKMKQLEWV